MVLKAVLFDFDGVIYPSTKFVYLSRKAFFKKFGINFKRKDYKKYLACGTSIFISKMNKIYDLNINVQEMKEFTRPKFKSLIKDNYTPNKGIKELILDLKKNKIRYGIASSNRKDIISYDLRKLGLRKYFKDIVAFEDVKNHKPAPEVYLKLMKKLNVKPNECIGIEDGPDGIISLKKAGVKSIALLTEFTSRHDFKKINADLVVSSIRELNLDVLHYLINNKTKLNNKLSKK